MTTGEAKPTLIMHIAQPKTTKKKANHDKEVDKHKENQHCPKPTMTP